MYYFGVGKSVTHGSDKEEDQTFPRKNMKILLR